MSKKKQRVQIGQVWKHCKTSNMYLIEKFTTDEATEKTMVIYKSLKDNRHWNRTLESFLTPGRFEFMHDGIVEAKLPGNLEDKLKISQLEDSNKNMTNEILELRKECRIKENLISIEKYQTEVFEKQVAENDKIIAKLQIELGVKNDEIRNLKHVNNFMKESGMLKTQTFSYRHFQEMSETLEVANATLSKKVQELEAENEKRICKLNDYQIMLKSQRDKYLELLKIQRYHDSTVNLKDHLIAELKDKNSKLEAENEKLGREVKFLKNECSTKIGIIESQLKYIAELKDKNSKLELLQIKCRGNSNYYSEIKKREIQDLKNMISLLESETNLLQQSIKGIQNFVGKSE